MSGALTAAGLLTANGGITSSGTLTFSGGASFSGTTDVQELREQVADVTLASNVGTLDWTAGNIYYIATAPSASMTFNVTNVPTDNSKIMTINVFVTQGSTGYIPTVFQIGGSSQTIRWAGGTAPTATSSAGKIDIFSFTMQRTSGGSWIVYGTSSLNF
jgi:autotransporter-associated beta strand protein